MTRPAEKSSRTGSPTGPMRLPQLGPTYTTGIAPQCGVGCSRPTRGFAQDEGVRRPVV